MTRSTKSIYTLQIPTLIKSIAILLVFLLAVFGKSIFGACIPFSTETPLLKILYSYSWWIIPGLLCTGLLFGFKKMVDNLGLSKNMGWAFLFSLATVSPMFISSAIMGRFDNSLSILDILRATVFAGLMEEFLFRGFLFGLLFRRLGWGFIPAGLVGALIFGWAHLYQGTSVGETFGVFIVTFMGALWFAWLYIEWNNNLWVPIFLHIFMNLSWTLFDMGENALGDVLTNVFRLITIGITVVLTVRHRKKLGSFCVSTKNLWVHPISC